MYGNWGYGHGFYGGGCSSGGGFNNYRCNGFFDPCAGFAPYYRGYQWY